MKWFILLLFVHFSCTIMAQPNILMSGDQHSVESISTISLLKIETGDSVSLVGITDSYIYLFNSILNSSGDSLQFRYKTEVDNTLNFDSERYAINLSSNPITPVKNWEDYDQMKFHDIDADGLKDLIIIHAITGQVLWCKNESKGRFSRPLPLYEENSRVDWFSYYDFSNDVIIYYSDKKIGTFNLLQPERDRTIRKSKLLSDIYIHGVADMNNDSKLDFILANTNTAQILLGNSKARVKKGDLITLPFELDQPYLVDMNEDSLVDILNVVDNAVYLYANTITGTFLPPVNIMDTVLIQTLAAEDFGYWEFKDVYWNLTSLDYDNDGDQDVLCHGEIIVLIENKGDGDYKSSRLSANLFDIDMINVEDIDNDGDQDIIVSSMNGLTIFRNDLKQFTELSTLNKCGYMNLYHWVDLDNDGDKDLLLADSCDGMLYWSEMTTIGFSLPILYQIVMGD